MDLNILKGRPQLKLYFTHSARLSRKKSSQVVKNKLQQCAGGGVRRRKKYFKRINVLDIRDYEKVGFKSRYRKNILLSLTGAQKGWLIRGSA